MKVVFRTLSNTKAANGGVLQKKLYLKIWQYLREKSLRWSLFLIKLQVFSRDIAKFLRTHILKNISKWLLLQAWYNQVFFAKIHDGFL